MKKIGKIVYAVPFAIFGLFHFLSGPAMAGLVPSYIPFPVVWVYLLGLALIAASVSIITGIKTHLATILLAVLLGIFVVLVHLPGAVAGNQMSTASLLKDVSLLGAALLIAGSTKD
ncbi:DoxX family protein [Leptospira gomenensis]|uniref:DoxX family protein n=1 Tax=Leptospira gomenensis TaxID=2484974 RepID=A0A5F1YFF1_9LEPT|nr:DoxX family protein [Leptospira gomenensis]TGK34374.1 DoxX family protein [Leptospira gomenensis]TGK37266.1 DoxX family protein [Leptospira gomenensis]TGK50953.1 DoxX family protein [Leptospira gomenensis]TGK56575.1 DoxX family protein [Leptospira gomenensis]